MFTGTKLSSNFNIKYPVPFTEKHDIIYRPVCTTESCNEDYVDECGRRLYVGETGHLPVERANFEVIGNEYRNNARHRNIAEALLVKKLKPTLNIQEKLIPLKLFN